MAVSKAQLAVWALIAGLGAWGYTVLSHVTLPEDLFALGPVARAATPQAPAVKLAPEPMPVAAVAVVNELPATIPEFPFPDFAALTPSEEPPEASPEVVSAFTEIPEDAIPEIAALAESDASVALETSVEEAVVQAKAPPIPAPPRKATRSVEGSTTLYVAADMVNVRAAPSLDSTVLQKVAFGFPVIPREQSAEWVGFLMKDGSTGWLRADFLSATKPADRPANTVQAATESQGDAGPLNLMM